MRQRNTYPGNSTPPRHKLIESSVGPVTHQGSFNPALLTQDSGSNILEIILSSRQKARTMVDVAVQVYTTGLISSFNNKIKDNYIISKSSTIVNNPYPNLLGSVT